MSGWLTLAAYVAAAGYAYRVVYRAMDADLRSIGGRLDAGDRFGCTAVSMFAALLWPVALLGITVHRFLRPTTEGDREDDLAEREAEVRRREAHIRRMERDLGIGADQ